MKYNIFTTKHLGPLPCTHRPSNKLKKKQLCTQKYLNAAWPLYGSFSTVRYCFLATNTKLHLDMHGFCTVQTFVNDAWFQASTAM